jgi:hypothetical protein
MKDKRKEKKELRREGKKKKNVGVFLEEEEEWESVMK